MSRCSCSFTLGESTAAGVLRRVAEAELAGLEELAERCRQLVDFEGLADETRFDAVVERSVRLRALVRRLEAQHEDREAREFDVRFQEFLRKTEFLKQQVERQRAAHVEPHGGSLGGPMRWDLYSRA